MVLNESNWQLFLDGPPLPLRPGSSDFMPFYVASVSRYNAEGADPLGREGFSHIWSLQLRDRRKQVWIPLCSNVGNARRAAGREIHISHLSHHTVP